MHTALEIFQSIKNIPIQPFALFSLHPKQVYTENQYEYALLHFLISISPKFWIFSSIFAR